MQVRVLSDAPRYNIDRDRRTPFNSVVLGSTAMPLREHRTSLRSGIEEKVQLRWCSGSTSVSFYYHIVSIKWSHKLMDKRQVYEICNSRSSRDVTTTTLPLSAMVVQRSLTPSDVSSNLAGAAKCRISITVVHRYHTPGGEGSNPLFGTTNAYIAQ